MDDPQQPADETRKAGLSQRHLTAMTIVGWVLLAVGAFIGYRLVLHYRIERRLDAFREAGYPVTLEDLAEYYPEVPMGENAAVVYERALWSFREPSDRKIGDVTPIQGFADLPPLGEPLPPEQLAAASLWVSLNRECLTDLHEAAAMPGCRFPLDFSGGIEMLLPHLAPMRNGARLLALENLLAIEQGETEQALASLHTGLKLQQALRTEPLLISQLVRIACVHLAVASMERTCSRLELSPEQIAELRARIERTEADLADALERAFAGELPNGVDAFDLGPAYWSYLSSLGHTTAPPTGAPGVAYKLTGLADLDELEYLDRIAPLFEAGELPIEEAIARARDVEHEFKTISEGRFLTRTLLPGLPRAMTEAAVTHAVLRAARTALAVERYRLKNGELPEDLETLAPEFLDSVPLDPFDGQPLKYRRLDPGFVIYSVGRDGRDNGGKLERIIQGEYDIGFELRR